MHKKLDDIEKKISFQVPESYFEGLPMKIQQRIELEKVESKPFRIPSWSLAMAASVIIIIGFVFLWNGNGVSAEELLAEVSDEDLIAYIDELSLDEYDLAAVFPETTNELEFDDINMMDGLEIDDLSIDDILLEYDLEEENLEI